MARFFIDWLVPDVADGKEEARHQFVKDHLKDGTALDFEHFLGTNRGYMIVEGGATTGPPFTIFEAAKIGVSILGVHEINTEHELHKFLSDMRRKGHKP